MDIKEEDFPMYQHLLTLNHPGVEYAKEDFEAAVQGGLQEKFNFAMGIQGITLDDSLPVPGKTDHMKQKTLQSCRMVFEEAARSRINGAEDMVQYFDAYKLGMKP